MSYMFRPNAVITLDGRDVHRRGGGARRSRPAARARRIRRGAAAAVAALQAGSATIGAKLELALGAQGQEATVFTGAVETVTHGPASLLIEALEPTAALHRKFISRTFLNQTVAAIVRDLADPVSVAAAESDLELGQYGVENRRSVWWHLRDLARLAGCDLGATAAGELLWRPRGRGDTRALRYGADMLAFSEGEGVAADAPAIAPHGSASAAGTDRWHWVNPDPLGQNPDPARVRGAIVSEAAATTASDAAKARGAARAKCGRVTVWGRPEVRPGDGIDLQNLPGERQRRAARGSRRGGCGGAGRSRGRRRPGMAGRAGSPSLRRDARLRQHARTGRRRVGRGRRSARGTSGRPAVSSLIDALRAIIRDELAARRPPELGIVTQVYPGDGNAGNHQADLRLRSSGLELSRVPVAVPRLGFSLLPRPGDLDECVAMFFASSLTTYCYFPGG